MSEQKSEQSAISVPSTNCSPFKTSDKRQLVFSIEGNIGVGKTTFLKLIKEQLQIDFEVINEPVDQWQQIKQGDQNLLDLFYKDPQRWGYTFQSYAFFSRVTHWKSIMSDIKTAKQEEQKIYVSERSIMSDNKIFAQNCHDMKLMNDAEMAIYQHWFSYLTKELVDGIDGYIYLKTDPQTCYERCQKRNREEESSIDVNYLTSIHEKHENWLGEQNNKPQENILVLHMNDNIIDNQTFQREIVNKVSNFMNKIKNQ